ncbi:MAG TPA: LysR substrate-binding domain-containing protein [Verrucomicrobiales bacterium]|jgi:LysR family hca operon transcriptional activator|nr:LysR substrate-binding domain-containing protein [Verrucomicrobiales bacterium]
MTHHRPMELRHLRYFVAVAAHGSFNRAAKTLHLTQPALSRQVKDLEDELGLPLVVRGQNAVELTEAGNLFYDEAREVLARADEAVRRVRGEVRSGTLRVGYSPSMTAGIMSAALEKFQSVSPRVHIELADLSSKEITEMAREGRLDLAICPGISIAKELPGFQWTELRRLEIVLIMPETHPLAKMKRIPPERLRGLPLIGLAKGNYPEYVPKVRGLLKPFGISPRFVSLVNDGILTLFTELEARRAAAVLTGGTIRIMPRTLTARPFAPRLPSAPVMLGLPASRPNPLAETFARMLLEEVRRQEK